MKILLTGATGFLGPALLQSLISSHYITHIYSLSRTPLPTHLSRHTKVTEIIRPDFDAPWITEELSGLKEQGVEGCIWLLGGAVARFKSYDEAMQANVSFPVKAAEAIVKDLIPTLIDDPDAASTGSESGSAAGRTKKRKVKPFRFVYMSVAGAEQDSFRSLWSQAQTRKMKGAAEKGLIEIADGELAGGMFEVYFLRAGRILVGGQSVGNVLTEAVVSSVSVEKVCKAAINAVLDGWTTTGDSKGETVRYIENGMILGDDWADINVQR